MRMSNVTIIYEPNSERSSPGPAQKFKIFCDWDSLWMISCYHVLCEQWQATEEGARSRSQRTAEMYVMF